MKDERSSGQLLNRSESRRIESSRVVPCRVESNRVVTLGVMSHFRAESSRASFLRCVSKSRIVSYRIVSNRHKWPCLIIEMIRAVSSRVVQHFRAESCCVGFTLSCVVSCRVK